MPIICSSGFAIRDESGSLRICNPSLPFSLQMRREVVCPDAGPSQTGKLRGKSLEHHMNP